MLFYLEVCVNTSKKVRYECHYENCCLSIFLAIRNFTKHSNIIVKNS